MSDFTATFEYMYAVSNNGVPVLDTVTASATKVDISDTAAALSDHAVFQVSGSDGPLDGDYTFISKASAAGGVEGFIAKDANGHSFFFSNGQPSASAGGQPLTPHEGSVPICFVGGTAIRTPGGERPVEDLAVGDLVVTADGREAAVRWIGRQTVVRTFADRSQLPIRLAAGALADNVPSRPLHVSPAHALFVNGVLIQAGCLVNGTSITRQLTVPPTFTYYHVELDDHALVLAENTPAETFLDNVDRARFDNWEEHERLYGSDRTMTELPYARAKAFRQVPKAIRARVDARAAALDPMAVSEAA